MAMTLTFRTVIKILLWIFCLSFALDFKGVLKSGAETGGSGVQMIYLAIALGSSVLIGWLGRRSLLTKPGVYMLMLWWSYLAFTSVVAVLNGVELALYADYFDVPGPIDLIIVADVLYDRENFPWLQRFLERAPEVLIADSRVKNFDVPPYRQVARMDSCTLPDLDESAEFRDVRIYRAP